MKSKGNNILLTVLFLLCLRVNGQHSPSQPESNSLLPFFNTKANTIYCEVSLRPFFDKLRQLENGDSIQLNIVHIGDSHIQADYLTRETRRNFQSRFGNAGRGFVFPLRLARTNEPSDFKTVSTDEWKTTTIKTRDIIPSPGLAGYSLYTSRDGAGFDLTTFDHDSLNYAFNKVKLFHVKDSLQFDCLFSDSASNTLCLMSSAATAPGDCLTEINLENKTSHIHIQTIQCNPAQTGSNIYGLSLENGSPGLLYHSIGVNGACYADYLNSPLCLQQLSLLHPDLIILSMGTNEGSHPLLKADEFSVSVEGLIQLLHEKYPDCCLLIITPTDSYYRRKNKNPYLKTVSENLVRIARQSQVACCDLYTITGGYGSCMQWRKHGMLRPDGIHFTREAYALQGKLLYKILIDSYTRYATD